MLPKTTDSVESVPSDTKVLDGLSDICYINTYIYILHAYHLELAEKHQAQQKEPICLSFRVTGGVNHLRLPH